MRSTFPLLMSIPLICVLTPHRAASQSKSISPGYSKAMHPKLSLTVRDYISTLPLHRAEASKFASGEPFFTYVGGDTTEIGIGAHQFPNGSVVFAIQTLSPDLPVTDNAPRKELSGVGADWYIVHFDPATGETLFASYYGTDRHDWLGDMQCEDSTFRCIFGGASQGAAVGKTTGPYDLLIAIMGFIDPVTLEEAYEVFCTFFDLDPDDWFSNAAFWMFLIATSDNETAAKSAAIPLGAGICGFRANEGRINGLVAIVNTSTCEMENVLESTFQTDDTFFGCFSDTGLDGTPFPVISAVGIRDNDANLAVDGTTTSTMCYAHANDTEMTCTDLPAAPPLDLAGKMVTVDPNDQYQAVQRDPDLGTFALGWNSVSGSGFIDYWASTDPSVVSSTEPLRVGTDRGHPFSMDVSNMGRVSFTTEWWDADTYFGQRIGTYVVKSAPTTGKTRSGNVGSLEFMNWTALPGVNRAALTTDLDDYPFRRGFTGASWFGIETSPTAIQAECPSGLNAPCASYGEVSPGLSYVSACNMTEETYGLDFATSSPGVTTESGFFFDITDTGSIEPGACSRLYSWPAEGGFDMSLSPGAGDPISVGSQADGIAGPFTTVILSDETHVVDVNDAPTIPRTFAVYFTNTLDESVDLMVYGVEGELYAASMEPLEAAVYNAEPASLGTTVYLNGTTAGGVEEVFALDLPDGDFVLQSLIIPGATGKTLGQGFEILVFNAMGAPTDTRVVTSAEQGADLPETHALHGNYPNPFNPTTRIAYDLWERSSVELEIINVFGQRVMSWSYRSQVAGRHSVTWDGNDSAGIPVASGVYLYRLSTESFSQTRKMTLLR